MDRHYSQPKGFVGRNICIAIYYDKCYYGHIVFGSATRFLKGRNESLGITISQLNSVANNIFYSVSKVEGKYPIRNFTSHVLKACCSFIPSLWLNKYRNKLLGFESLVEMPRNGDLYRKAGWQAVGETTGFTCKRVSGNGTDSWGGKRVWNTDPENLRPKTIFTLKLPV